MKQDEGGRSKKKIKTSCDRGAIQEISNFADCTVINSIDSEDDSHLEDIFSQTLFETRALFSDLKANQKIAFNDCRVVVVESILNKTLTRGSRTLIEHPNSWGQNQDTKASFEWVLTSADIVRLKRVTGPYVMHEKFRIRIPKLSRWSNPAEDFEVEDYELYHDYTFPIAKDSNTFLHPELENIALVRIPAHFYQRGISHGLFPKPFSGNALAVMGLSETVKHRKLAVLLTVDTNRDGNEADVARITALLPNLGYEVIQPTNPTRREMIRTLISLQKKPKDSYQ